MWATFSDWRKQYVNKKKEKEARASPSPAAAVVVKKAKADSRENIISQIIDLMCRVDWQDYELRSVWTVLENLRSLVPAGGGKGAAA